MNWFRKDADGSFLWPGFGENSRVVEWIVRRIEGTASSVPTPAGKLPTREEFNLDGLPMTDETWDQLFDVDPSAWLAETQQTEALFARFDGRVPQALQDHLHTLRWDLQSRLPS